MPDDFDPVVAARCRAVDDVPVPADIWSRVQLRVLDRLPGQVVEHDATMVELERPSPAEEHRKMSKRVVLAALTAAAAIVAIALVAIRKDDPVSPADQPSPAVTVSPSVTATPTSPPAVGNPLVDIRAPLVDMGDVELFRIKSESEHYWRITTLPEFDGDTFALPRRALDPIDDIDGGAPEGDTIRQQIQILALTGPLIPAAAEVYQVSPNDDMRFNADTGTLITVTDLVPGERFTILSVEPDLIAEHLRTATTDDPPDDIYLDLPADVPDDVYDIAAAVTAGATTDHGRLVSLQDWFRENFEYSTDVPAGHGNDAIEHFLQIRKGYCEQFATTFAVMARTLGIPSRVAVGYTPGRLRADGWYSVVGRNSHAWPEIWFDSIGWVGFEPTPTRSIPGAERSTVMPAAQDESLPTAPTSAP